MTRGLYATGMFGGGDVSAASELIEALRSEDVRAWHVGESVAVAMRHNGGLLVVRCWRDDLYTWEFGGQSCAHPRTDPKGAARRITSQLGAAPRVVPGVSDAEKLGLFTSTGVVYGVADPAVTVASHVRRVDVN
jgi:hypothetical protein